MLHWQLKFSILDAENDIINDIDFNINDIDSFATELLNNISNYEIEEQLNLSDMSKLGEDSAARIFGQPATGGEHGQDSIYLEVLQGTDSTCAVRSQEIILRDYGIFVSESQLADFAEQHGLYSPVSGTSPEAMGLLLEYCGINMEKTEGNTVYDLVNELSQGHRVMVAVDSGELWQKTFGDKARETFEDLITDHASEDFQDKVSLALDRNISADHALIVAGVEVNPDNPSDVKVVLTDSGTGELRVEYPLDQFMDAWEDSNCLMVATTEPAPFQYNEQTCRLEPSNFATEFYVNQFVKDNSLNLPTSAIPEVYQQYAAKLPIGYAATSDSYKAHYTEELIKSQLSKSTFGQTHFDADSFKDSIKSLFGISSEHFDNGTDEILSENPGQNTNSDSFETSYSNSNFSNGEDQHEHGDIDDEEDDDNDDDDNEF